jgi:hypothetical protein
MVEVVDHIYEVHIQNPDPIEVMLSLQTTTRQGAGLEHFTTMIAPDEAMLPLIRVY